MHFCVAGLLVCLWFVCVRGLVGLICGWLILMSIYVVGCRFAVWGKFGVSVG